MTAMQVSVPDELVEAIARRAAEIVRQELELAGGDRAPEYLTVREAADRLRSRPQRVYDLLSSGRLRRYKDGSRVLVRTVELDAYLVAQALPTSARGRMAARGSR